MNPEQINTWFLNFGGGLNSSAAAVELMARGYPAPAAVFFADTGGERPATYHHVQEMSDWLVARGWPAVQIVRWIRKRGPHAGQFVSLEQQCIKRKELPSLAYGNKGCSVKWKAQPVDAAVLAHPATQAAKERGDRVVRVLGYDADEPHRWNRSNDNDTWTWWAPLVEWDMGREECRETVQRAGFGVVPKSACFFCPATKAREVLEMQRNNPDLLARALEIEANANNFNPDHGLGGPKRKWSSLLEFERRQIALWPPMLEEPCGCFDGGSE